MFSCQIYKIFKKTCSEEYLRKTTSKANQLTGFYEDGIDLQWIIKFHQISFLFSEKYIPA